MLLLVAGLASGGLQAADAMGTPPWRLSPALDLPDWFNLSGTQRTRYETLDGQFRALRQGSDQMLAFRTTLRADVEFDPFGVTGEFSDSRQALADTGTPIDTTMVDTLELLQAYASVKFDNWIAEGSRSEIRFGRQTLDIGSRRLVSRNQFRNAVNSFTGVHGQWEIEKGPTVRLFYVLPVVREPMDPSSLLDNEAQFDSESFDLQFWGLHAQWPRLWLGGTGELYVFGLHENDAAGLPTRNRQLYTPGLRLSRPPAKGAWNFDFESAVQVGTLRATLLPADTTDLDHVAHFEHAEVGYTFDQAWSPRLDLLFDYASGDQSPSDQESNRFDTLFGSRRFEHGPTGIYGAFTRSNIQSPGCRMSLKPTSSFLAAIAYRPYWLASATDAWITGVRDPSGQSGSFIGHQLEARLRWDALPGNVGFEVGGALLFAGEFIRNVPGPTPAGDTTYGYASVDITF